jgi:biotin-dependent carboxylase-like uncharacterized protein
MIELLSSGFYTTIQDLGRYQFTHYGVPLSGSMDKKLSKLANLLVGNSINEAVIEMTYSGPKLKFHSDCVIAISAFKAEVLINQKPIQTNHQVKVENGDVLTIQKIENRAYLAVKSGIDAEKKLNSYSQYSDITKHSKLSKGDKIKFNATDFKFNQKNSSIRYDLSDYENYTLKVYPLPEFELLHKDVKAELKLKKFSIASKSNRMAYQFEETVKNQLTGIRSKPVCPGTVQLTPEGKLIVLMRDAQVTGGYPRIFQLTEQSINVLSQRPIKSKIRFKIKTL